MVDWKKIAIDDLRRYPHLKESLLHIPKKIEALEEYNQSIKGGMSGSEPVSGGTSTSEDRLISNICERERLGHNYNAVSKLVAMIETALGMLNPTERKVLERFYINRSSGYVERLCDELGYEKSRIYQIKEDALLKYTRTMYGLIEL
jgi:DNA-directed RNA polymerase sigma subunit (sigma70/sigma32)